MSVNIPWPQERKDTLARLWADGLTASQISRELNGAYTRSAVLGMVNRLGLPKRKVKGAARVAYSTVRTVRRRAAYFAQHINKPKLFKPITPKPDASVVPPGFRGLTLQQLEPWHCRYPRGEQSPYLFCGAPIERDRYCAHCYPITHWIAPVSIAA